MNDPETAQHHEITVDAEGVPLPGTLTIPRGAEGLVLFAHGSGSSRHSPRNRFVADHLNDAGLGTLLFDLLTPAEDKEDARTGRLRFDINLLADRLIGAVDWIRHQEPTRGLSLGLFGASTGAAAALIAAAERPEAIEAVVSRGGRPDLAEPALPRVKAPTLLIVGGNDAPVIGMNSHASNLMNAECHIEIIPGAGHLFEEPGKLDQVARFAGEWFTRYLALAHH